MYGIPHCDTVKRARAWLTDHGLAYQFYDFKKQGVPTQQLDHWVARVGWEKLLNRQGTTWRKLEATAQAAVQDETSAKALMQAQPSVIKRPVVQWGDPATGTVTVGLDAATWPPALPKARRAVP